VIKVIEQDELPHPLKWIAGADVAYHKNSDLLAGAMVVSHRYKKSHGIAWVSIILLLSYCIYLLFRLLKAVIKTLQMRKNLLWLPLFMATVTYSCIFPLWMIYETTSSFLQKIWSGNTPLNTITMGVAFWIYFRCHFLTTAKKLTSP